MEFREAYDLRRKEFSSRLPAHYCSSCSCIAFPEDTHCLDCGTARPGEEWPTIQDGFDPWLGRVLDSRYLITKRVGRGTTGAVYRADSLHIFREFAVKIVNFKESASGSEPDLIRSRLAREIETISRLRNPHVVPFYEVLELFDDFAGIVMDFVDGQTLESLVYSGGPVTKLRAARILRQIANGIHEAHEAGMIHRDLKPENLMLEIMPAGDDFVHILDFGIVHLEGSVSMTQGFLGTPLYASPEQAMAGDVDRRSDIYSLGAIFFFMLTGRPPFVGDNVYEVLRSHVRTKAPRLGEVTTSLSFPPDLEDMVEAMLSKSPNARPQTLAHVIELLDQLIRNDVLKEPSKEPDSMEIELIHVENRVTGELPPIARGVGDTNSSLEIDERRRKSPSGSFLVSSERDLTGPKAAIFSRNASKPSIRRLIQDSSQEMRRPSFDRIMRSGTGVFPAGLKMDERLKIIAADRSPTIVLVDERDDVFLAKGNDAIRVHSGFMVSSAAACCGNAVIGTETGEIFFVGEGRKPEVLFQDVRERSIEALAVGGKHRLIVAGSSSGRVYMCRRFDDNASNWNRIQDGPPVLSVAVNHIGNLFAVARKHGEVGLFNTSSPRVQFIRFSTVAVVRSMSFSLDGHLLAILFEDDTIALHMVLSGERVMNLKDEKHTLACVTFNEDNELIGYFSNRGVVFRVDLQRELNRA